MSALKRGEFSYYIWLVGLPFTLLLLDISTGSMSALKGGEFTYHIWLVWLAIYLVTA